MGCGAIRSHTALNWSAPPVLQMVRLIRASRMWKRWQSSVSVSHSTTSMVQCLLLILIWSHWSACIWMLPVRLHGCMVA